MTRYRPIMRLLAVLVMSGVLALGWRYLAQQGFIAPDRLVSMARDMAALYQMPWLLLLIALLYIVALMLMFPLTILVMVTGLLFGPWWGLLYATVGTLSSSAVSFWVGRVLGEAPLKRYSGTYLQSLSRYMSERSMRAMIIINLLPLAPFTFTNLMAGAFGLPFPRYLLGSAIGIIPGLAVVTLLGGQLSRMLMAEQMTEVWLAAGIAVVLVVLIMVARWYLGSKAWFRLDDHAR